MIRIALVIAAAQGDIDGGLDAVRPVLTQHLPEQVSVQPVHLVVVALELECGGDVSRRDHTACLGHDPLRHLAHLQDRRAQLGRDRGGRVAQPCDLRHMQRPVTHPFEVCAHPQAGDDRAQVGGYRLLAGEQVECAALQVMPKIIDEVVGFDHGLGEIEISVEQSAPLGINTSDVQVSGDSNAINVIQHLTGDYGNVGANSSVISTAGNGNTVNVTQQ